MKRNIPLLFVTASLVWVRFYIPILALFYIASQVTFKEFTIIIAVFSLVTLLLEVPSGVFADLLGKKNSLLCSRFCYIIHMVILAFFNGFWPLLIGQIIAGVGVSLTSGAKEAILYDTLKKLGREKEHKRLSGYMFAVTQVTMAIVFILGGVLFMISPKLPAIASIPFLVLGFILTFFLKEPYVNKKRPTLRNSFLHLKEGLVYFWHHDYVKYLVFYYMFIMAIIDISLSSSSVYLEHIRIPVYLIGVIAFVTSMITAYTSKTAYVWEERIGEKNSLFLIQLLLLVSVFTMSLMIDYIGVLFYLLIPLILGFFEVVINHYVNIHIATSHRATMLSIKNLFNHAAIFLLFPLFGHIKEVMSMSTAFVFVGVFFVIYAIGLYVYSTGLHIKQIEKD